MATNAVMNIEVEGLKKFKEGKVRTVFDMDDKLLLVVSDRVSAYDVILPTPIPGKGKILTQISAFWFELTKDIVPNHVISTNFDDFGIDEKYRPMLEGRSTLVKKTDLIEIECVVRGYISGSAWKEYQQNGCVCGIKLPEGLKESDKLDTPIFTPATKAATGHDENISFERMCEITGQETADKLKETSLKLFKFVSEYALERGIIIADTKFEFGVLDGQIILIDEIFTPDSSRFWSKEDYVPGKSQDSFDKQFVRDYLSGLEWDKEPPGPELPESIVEGTCKKYEQALQMLTTKK